jgi:hypothetical protein
MKRSCGISLPFWCVRASSVGENSDYRLVYHHRYLMSRFTLQGFYLWCHVLSTAPPFILWWPNLEILFVPVHHSFYFIRRLRCQPIQKEHSLYIAERTQKAGYNVRCLCIHTHIMKRIAVQRYIANEHSTCRMNYRVNELGIINHQT